MFNTVFVNIYSAFSYIYFNFIFMPRNSQQGDLYNGFLFNRGRQFQRPSENALPSFYPNTTQSTGSDYGTLYGPAPSSYPAQDLQELSSSSHASSGSSQQSQSPEALKMIPTVLTANAGTAQRLKYL